MCNRLGNVFEPDSNLFSSELWTVTSKAVTIQFCAEVYALSFK
jgi:hypothetical protein